VPNHLHKRWTIESANNRKHVLCEKPFSLSVNDAEEMFEVCKENNVLVMEAFMYRFNPAIKKIKELVDSPIIGDLKSVEFSFSHDIFQYLSDVDNYRFQKEYGGGALLDLGVYGLSICNFILNAPPTQVLKSIAVCEGESGIDNSFFGTFKYEEDILCNIIASFQFFGKHLILSGTKGSIEVPNIISMSEIPIHVKNTKFELVESVLSPACDHYQEQVTHFNNCIINRKKPLITAQETLNILMTIEEAFDSMIRIKK